VESARAEGIEREALTERQRAEANAGASQRLGLEAHRIRERAEAAAAAVASLDHQAGMLRQSVQEIAQRCQQAATTAATGQETTDAAGGEVRRLEQAMSEISDVNQMIGQLAAQTNLLSLNATIEAARAGEMGKGFAVVAAEVKALANETGASAEKVRAVVEGVVQETEKVARSFSTTSALVGEIGGAQTDIAASVEEQAAVLAEVTRHTAAAAAATHEITLALSDLIAAATSL
jgi:methyl-accepting chemotaxis protein